VSAFYCLGGREKKKGGRGGASHKMATAIDATNGLGFSEAVSGLCVLPFLHGEKGGKEKKSWGGRGARSCDCEIGQVLKCMDSSSLFMLVTRREEGKGGEEEMFSLFL